MRQFFFILLILILIVPVAIAQEPVDESAVKIWWPDTLLQPESRTVIEDEFANIEELNEISLDVRRRVYAEGDMARQLSLTKRVAPDALPDLVLMRRQDVVDAVRRGIVFPIEEWLPIQFLDLSDSQRALGTVEGDLYGLPYLLEIQHIMYDPAQLTDPPESTAEVLELQTSLLFPASPRENAVVNKMLLSQYVAAGGRFSDEDGSPSLDEDILSDLLGFYERALQDELVASCLLDSDDCLLNYTSPRDYLSDLPTETPTLSLMDSRVFMQRRELRYAEQSITSIPTLDGNEVTLIDGWMWVLITEDPVRRDEAQRFIDLMYSSDTMSAIASSLFLLPSQESARRVMGDADYLEFMSELLESSIFVGEDESRSAAAAALQTAFESVLQGTASGDAVESAINSLAGSS